MRAPEDSGAEELPGSDLGGGSAWRLALAKGRINPADVLRWRSELASNPSELQCFEEELALSQVLDSRFRPKASSNFAAQVAAKIAAEERGTARKGYSPVSSMSGPAKSWLTWYRWLRPTLAAVVLTMSLGLGVRQFRRYQQADMAAALKAAESLVDYDPILRLGIAPNPGDDALIQALAENQ